MSVDFRPGDLIFTYHKGIHKCNRIEDRKGNTPLIYYIPICDSSFKTKNYKEELRCDGAYCRKVDLDVLRKQKQAEFDQYMANLEKIVATYGISAKGS